MLSVSLGELSGNICKIYLMIGWMWSRWVIVMKAILMDRLEIIAMKEMSGAIMPGLIISSVFWLYIMEKIAFFE